MDGEQDFICRCLDVVASLDPIGEVDEIGVVDESKGNHIGPFRNRAWVASQVAHSLRSQKGEAGFLRTSG